MSRPIKSTASSQSRTVQDVGVVGEKKNEISIDDYLLNNILLSLSPSCMLVRVFVCLVDDTRDSVVMLVLGVDVFVGVVNVVVPQPFFLSAFSTTI